MKKTCYGVRRIVLLFRTNNNLDIEDQGIVKRRWIIFKLNFSDLFKIGKLQTLDEKEQEIKEIEEEINKEKIEHRRKRIEKYSIK